MDVELRPELLPNEEFVGYFSFEPGVLADIDGERLIGAYVFVSRPDPVKDSLLSWAHLAFRASVVPETPARNIALTFSDPTSLIMGLNFGEHFDEMLKRSRRVSSEFRKSGESVPRDIDIKHCDKVDERIFRTLINAVMYIHSLNPDVTHLKPVNQQTSRERKETVKNGLDLNNSIYPLVYVSWNYGKGVVYSKDSTIVRTHFRWQPCGPGRGQTKLIIVQEHERHFKNVTPDASVSAP